jgi:hypothetical protein
MKSATFNTPVGSYRRAHPRSPSWPIHLPVLLHGVLICPPQTSCRMALSHPHVFVTSPHRSQLRMVVQLRKSGSVSHGELLFRALCFQDRTASPGSCEISKGRRNQGWYNVSYAGRNQRMLNIYFILPFCSTSRCSSFTDKAPTDHRRAVFSSKHSYVTHKIHSFLLWVWVFQDAEYMQNLLSCSKLHVDFNFTAHPRMPSANSQNEIEQLGTSAYSTLSWSVYFMLRCKLECILSLSKYVFLMLKQWFTHKIALYSCMYIFAHTHIYTHICIFIYTLKSKQNGLKLGTITRWN